MGQEPHRRILVAVEPLVVEGALAALLTIARRARVLQFHQLTSEDRSVRYDAAIVTSGIAQHVRAEILITLPDTEVSGGLAHVTAGGVSRTVDLRTHEDVVDLLAEHFPYEIPDIHRLANATGLTSPSR